MSQPPVGAPGERFEYANGGFYIAGAIIEKVTGNDYAEEVDRRVIQPLGLTHTRVQPTTETGYPAPHPRAYSQQFLKDGADPAAVTPENWQSLMEEPGLPPLDVTELSSSSAYAAGNVVTTTTDLIRFFTAMTTGSLLPPAQHRRMWTTVSTEGGHWMPHARYGLGMFEFDKQATGGAGPCAASAAASGARTASRSAPPTAGTRSPCTPTPNGRPGTPSSRSSKRSSASPSARKPAARRRPFFTEANLRIHAFQRTGTTTELRARLTHGDSLLNRVSQLARTSPFARTHHLPERR
ncbi:serine hydrolase domain-containing protein [Nonomuraea longicatena]|uniref:Beta-lactamase-related domain-containing protein n=1 Tax=Nonomuraea longicatena TaxID=83682 RepID=A0ABN1QIR8_9ACTN